jgi:hypothetical protein
MITDDLDAKLQFSSIFLLTWFNHNARQGIVCAQMSLQSPSHIAIYTKLAIEVMLGKII